MRWAMLGQRAPPEYAVRCVMAGMSGGSISLGRCTLNKGLVCIKWRWGRFRMAVTWGDFQAVVQLSAGLNVAILSFVDISLPAIKERRRVFAKARQELDIYRKNPHKRTVEDKAVHAEAVGEVDRQLFDLWKETSAFESIEDSLMKSTGVFGFFGAVLSISLLWYSALHYEENISLAGEILTVVSFFSLAGAFLINFFTASKASQYAKRCNDLREHMRKKL